MAEMVKDLNSWLSYSVVPAELTTHLRPAMWGNGQVELLAELKRPCVSEAICFGYGQIGLTYRDEQHLIPAIYEAGTGKKYFLYSTPSSEAKRATVTFRPDRQVWRYEFDDLDVEVSLFLPRLIPGYLFKLELYPKKGNRSPKWHIYYELRSGRGALNATEADYKLHGGTVWCRGTQENWEAIGGTLDAERINLGEDGAYATDIMVKTIAERGNEDVVTAYLARAFGGTAEEVRETLTKLLSSPENLKGETEDWWNRYLNDVPRLTVPDESFSKNFLWSWPNFRMNRIDVTSDIVPAGQYYNNWSYGLREVLVLSHSEHPQGEAIQLLHDPQPAHDYILLHFYLTHKKRGLLAFDARVDKECEIGEAYHFPRSDYETLGWVCGIIYKYVLTTGDLALLQEKYDGKTKVLERLEEDLEARMEYRDDQTGLYFVEGGRRGKDWSSGLHPILESSPRFREGGKSFYCDCNAAMWATFVVMAEIEDLARNNERSGTYREMAEDLRNRIQRYMWNEELQFFCDLKLDGSFGDYVGLGGFIAGLMANHVYRPGGVATREQAEKLAEWCERPDFANKYGVVGLASSSPYFDPADFKGLNQGLGIYRQISPGLYGHGCYEEAHRQLFKIFRRMGENGGLGPRYRGEMYNTDTGEILPWRFHNFTGMLAVLTSVIEGVFGIRWTKDALTVHVNSPWPWAKLSKLRIRKSLLDLELTADGTLIAKINGKEVARSADRKVKLAWKLFA